MIAVGLPAPSVTNCATSATRPGSLAICQVYGATHRRGHFAVPDHFDGRGLPQLQRDEHPLPTYGLDYWLHADLLRRLIS